MSFSGKKIHTIACLVLMLGTAHAGQFGETRLGFELLQLERETDQNITYVWDNGGTVNAHADDTPVGRTGAFDDAAGMGYRLSAARKMTPRWSLQAAYMTGGELSESQSFSDPSSQLEIFWGGGTDEFDAADIVQASYTSELDGFELNLVYAVSDRIDIFGGIGRLNLDEKFRLVSDDLGTVGVGRYNINTTNELLGPQLGGNLNYPATEKMGIYLLAKIGWYDNNTKQRQTVSDPVPAVSRDVKVSDNTSATTLEIRLGGTYEFHQNLRMNLGYQYYKITDVALAESQFDVETGGTTLSNDDEITWQGLNLGINYFF